MARLSALDLCSCGHKFYSTKLGKRYVILPLYTMNFNLLQSPILSGCQVIKQSLLGSPQARVQ